MSPLRGWSCVTLVSLPTCCLILHARSFAFATLRLRMTSVNWNRQLLGILLFLLIPEAMAGAVDEHVFERWLADRDRLNLSGKGVGKFGDEAMALLLLQ